MQEGSGGLLERLVAGDSAAAEEVGGWVRRAASPFRRRLGSEWDDVVQDSLLELLEAARAGRCRGESSLRGYVWRLAASNCLDRLRRRRRWIEVELEDTPAPAGDGTLAALLADEARDRLVALARSLPLACRELWRDLLAGRGYREMSARWGVSEGTLRVRVLRCRRRALATLAEAPGNRSPGRAPIFEEERGA